MNKQAQGLEHIRREYGEQAMTKDSVLPDPIEQFNLWLQQALQAEHSDPTAMVLATVDEQGYPDCRVVLLKGIHDAQFVFYTNYQSAKAKQLMANQRAVLHFYWPDRARQVRIRGEVSRLPQALSDHYFSTRPRNSQLSAWASPQSQVVASRQWLEQQWQACEKKYAHQAVPRPEYWGGYQLQAEEFEFWQGRNDRLHDRLYYQRNHQGWKIVRLAP